MSNYHIRPIAWIVKPDSEPIFSKLATRVKIMDESGGEFVTVTDGDGQSISIDPENWNELSSAINSALRMIKQAEKDTA